jgi:hypothetical protein
MENYTNIILTLIFMGIFFMVMFLKRNTSAVNKLSSKIEELNSKLTLMESDNTLNFYKLQIDELKESLLNLSIKVKKL